MADDRDIDWTLSEHDQTFLLPGESEISHATMRRRIGQYYAQVWGKAHHDPSREAGQAAIRTARKMLELASDNRQND